MGGSHSLLITEHIVVTVQSAIIDIFNTHMTVHSCLDAGTSMEHNEVKLILCCQAFPISEMIRAYKYFSPLVK